MNCNKMKPFTKMNVLVTTLKPENFGGGGGSTFSVGFARAAVVILG